MSYEVTAANETERKRFLRTLAVLGAVLALCRFTHGVGLFAIGAIGVFSALSHRMGVALCVFLLIPFLTIINPILLPRTGGFSACSRILAVSLSFSMLLGSMAESKARGSGSRLPLTGVVFFLLAAFLSSIQGIFPLISFFKLINFSLFLLGLYAGTAELEKNQRDTTLLRNVLLALATLLVFGSLLALFFPVVAYYTSSLYYIASEGLEYANDLLSENQDGLGLFSGITVHSQFLGPALACLSCWISCDLFLGNGELKWLHFLLLVCIPPMIFMTRSRAGLVTYVISWCVLSLHFYPQIHVSLQRRRKVIVRLVSGIFVLLSIAWIFESQNQTITRWLRKTDDVVGDHRALKEAVTGSRHGLITRCLSDFSKNPLLGTGFQVMEEHVSAYRAGRLSLFSAPIEKGLLPLMLLGETGIVGTLFFLVFLFSFFAGCRRKGYVATSTLFLVYLSTNLAESTFFSPSGSGGVMWCFCVLGGFAIDMATKQRHTESMRRFLLLNPMLPSPGSVAPE